MYLLKRKYYVHLYSFTAQWRKALNYGKCWRRLLFLCLFLIRTLISGACFQSWMPMVNECVNALFNGIRTRQSFFFITEKKTVSRASKNCFFAFIFDTSLSSFVVWGLQSCPTTVLSEIMWHFRGMSRHAVVPPIYFQGTGSGPPNYTPASALKGK